MATLVGSLVRPLPCLVAVALLAGGMAVAQPPGGREGGRGMFRMPLMAALDADGDGEISAKEIDDAPARLRTLDANKDGTLTMDELRPAGGPGGFGGGGRGGAGGEEMVNRLMEYDTDKDGKLKAEDLPERMRNIVTRADTNKDGVVTRDELLATSSRPEGGPGREGRGQRQRPAAGDDHEEHEEHEHREEGRRGDAGRRPPVEE